LPLQEGLSLQITTAFPNLSGGYEVRNRYFKGSIGKKDISLLAKRKKTVEDSEIQPPAVTVFET